MPVGGLNMPSDTSDPRSVRELLAAMGKGERDAAAEFVTRYGPLIRRRVRGKLKASMRRLFDSQDILSTLSRRLDSYVHRGLFEPRSEDELWGLVFTIAEHSIAEKARIWRALSAKEGQQSGLAREAAGRYGQAERSAGVMLADDDDFEELLESVPQQVDRQIARLWAMDLSSEAIAAELGLTVDVVRTRWRRTRDRLRSRFEVEAP
jgi:DNA-directed RNA polymerase specialized sigma24 family protein